MHEKTPLGERILKHWQTHHPQMVAQLRKEHLLEQTLHETEERTAVLLYELILGIAALLTLLLCLSLRTAKRPAKPPPMITTRRRPVASVIACSRPSLSQPGRARYPGRAAADRLPSGPSCPWRRGARA